jgi:hypothetical protein
LYERAFFNGEADALSAAERELDAPEADLAASVGAATISAQIEEARSRL